MVLVSGLAILHLYRNQVGYAARTFVELGSVRGNSTQSVLYVTEVAVHNNWIPAQICLEQICINPKDVRQDSLTSFPAGMTRY